MAQREGGNRAQRQAAHDALHRAAVRRTRQDTTTFDDGTVRISYGRSVNRALVFDQFLEVNPDCRRDLPGNRSAFRRRPRSRAVNGAEVRSASNLLAQYSERLSEMYWTPQTSAGYSEPLQSPAEH